MDLFGVETSGVRRYLPFNIQHSNLIIHRLRTIMHTAHTAVISGTNRLGDTAGDGGICGNDGPSICPSRKELGGGARNGPSKLYGIPEFLWLVAPALNRYNTLFVNNQAPISCDSPLRERDMHLEFSEKGETLVRMVVTVGLM